IGELLHFTLHHDRSALALERFHSEQNRNGPGAGRAIERHVHPFAAGDLYYARERILLLDADGEVRTELSRNFHAAPVLARSGDDDERGAGLLADHGRAQPLL